MAERETVDVIEDGDGRRPDYAGDYHNATYHDDGTVTITTKTDHEALLDAIDAASNLSELQDALAGRATGTPVQARDNGPR